MFDSIDPRVRSVLLKRAPYSLDRVAMAAALCPELLGERDRWTGARSLAAAELQAEECGRTPEDVRRAVFEWMITPQNSKTAKAWGDRLSALALWDYSLALWVVASLIRQMTEQVPEYAREPLLDAAAQIEMAARLPKSDTKVGRRLAEDFSENGEFAGSMYEANEADSNHPQTHPWYAATRLIGAVRKLGLMMTLGSARDTNMEGVASSLFVASAHLVRHQIGRISSVQTQREIDAMLERAIASYPLGYRERSSGAIRASGWALPAVAGAAPGAQAQRHPEPPLRDRSAQWRAGDEQRAAQRRRHPWP